MAIPRRPEDGVTVTDGEALSRAIVLLNRYSVGLNEVVARTLGQVAGDNPRIEILVVVHRRRGITPSELADALGASRSVTARHISALVSDDLLVRHRSPHDGRSRQLALTRKGSHRVGRFADELVSYFVAQAPLVKDAIDPWLVTADRRDDDVFSVIGAMARAGHRFTEEHRWRLAALNVRLSWHETSTLSFLHQVGSTRPSRLAEEIGLSRQGTNDLIDRLEAAGLVVRSGPRAGDDGRAVHLSLTEKGTSAAVRVTEAMAVCGEELAVALTPTMVWAEDRP